MQKENKETKQAIIPTGKVIEKKILPTFFNAVVSGKKRFEIRKDEDKVAAGDTVRLREWDGSKYTGKSCSVLVTYVLRDMPEYGLKVGYCIFCWNKYEKD